MKKKRQWFMCLGMIGVFTASVILSVFGQRKVKAQLNTENAGKITSSWADEKHIFSSFDDEKALSVDASYGFKMHATDQTKTIIEAGKKAAKLPEIEMPRYGEESSYQIRLLFLNYTRSYRYYLIGTTFIFMDSIYHRMIL